jgi:hypothetical protein
MAYPHPLPLQRRGPSLSQRCLSLTGWALAAVIGHAAPAASQSATIAGPVVAGAATRGGLVEGSRIVRVSSLADSGNGSLRAALDQKGPKVIVFDIGGVIELKSDLRLWIPNVTVAGQTAPSPGIMIKGAKLRIVAPDVVVQHISVHPIERPRPGRVFEIDAINVGECMRCPKQVADVRLENVSTGWANDENVDFWGDKLQRMTLRNSIIAEGLRQAGHPKFRHSMGLLIGQGVQGAEVVGNLFASNVWRSPVLGGSASAFVANNYIYNPGEAAIHFYDDWLAGPTRGTFIGNVVKRGPDTNPRLTEAVQTWPAMADPPHPAEIFAADNHCCSGVVGEVAGRTPLVFAQALEPPLVSHTWQVIPGPQVVAWVARYAGSRPAERNPIDARVLASVASGDGRVIDSPLEVGGHPDLPAERRLASTPEDPFAPAPRGLTAESRLEAWLCLKHFEVGGPPTPECRDQPESIRAAFTGIVHPASSALRKP